MEKYSKEVWDKWSIIHNDTDQIKRLKSATKAECTPILIDYDSVFGYFQGHHGKYETFLDQCSCIDFSKRKKPCKHMYRLALELKLINEDFESDTNKIVKPKATQGISAQDAIALIENLSQDAQIILWNYLYQYIYQKEYEVGLINSLALDELIHSCVLIQVENLKALLNPFSRNEINKILSDNSIKCNKNLKYDNLLNWCVENIPNLIPTICKDNIVICLDEDYELSKHKIYKYLNAKYQDLRQSYFNI